MSSLEKNTIFVAVDIEKCGPLLIAHKVVSVGICIGDGSKNIIERKKFNLKVKWWVINDDDVLLPYFTDYGDFEEGCLKQFWSKLNASVLEACYTNPEPLEQTDGWHAIAEYIDSLETTYQGHQIKFLTDNGEFDIGNINYNLEKYVDRKPMRYSTTGEFRSVINTKGMLKMIPPKERTDIIKQCEQEASHNHDCVSDAENIYLQYIKAVDWTHNK